MAGALPCPGAKHESIGWMSTSTFSESEINESCSEIDVAGKADAEAARALRARSASGSLAFHASCLKTAAVDNHGSDSGLPWLRKQPTGPT
jgi:hypothetical protein